MSNDVFQLPDFTSRHIGIGPADQAEMLAELGFSTLDQLVTAAVPDAIRMAGELNLPPAMTEREVLAELRSLAEGNVVRTPMMGLGYHGTETPPVIRRNILESPAWYTAYTPYQPEISQGRLEALLNFQTMVADLTGLPTANASLLDEATAVAEAVSLMRRSCSSSSMRVLVDSDTLPQTLDVLRVRCEPIGIEIVEFDVTEPLPAEDLFGLVLSLPGASGAVRDHRALLAAAHERGALVSVTADLLSLVLLTPPGEIGADVVVGSTQRFGVPLFYGGPHAGFMVVRDGLQRDIPGRLVGVSVDSAGNPAYRLALQTREQHIRRDRATSNICTAQVLLAVVASMYAVYHGAQGLRGIARDVHEKASRLASALERTGHSLRHASFFDTVQVKLSDEQAASAVRRRAHENGLLVLQRGAVIGVSCSEITTERDLELVLHAFGCADPTMQIATPSACRLPEELQRTSDFLTHPVFERHRSETDLLRYMRRLSDQDLALDRGMIPLGSCTMKLNATAEMEPVSYSGFADLHPFAPFEDVQGYLALSEQLETWLAEVTGYAKVSIQPNAGSQGELAGLLAIRAYHQDRGQAQRDVCLIPASAHGTNAASAVMAGMRVVVVASRPDGTVDLDDLQSKCETNSDQLAAIMVTYPSTHGVYESGITELCTLVHEHGGQVYLDGANLNALLGVGKLGELGGDVSHLNLHKTFCIPHGGGGPGVGPVAVARHLVPYLPSHRHHPDEARRTGLGPVSAAPLGSAGILPIPWAYIRLMGAEGLARATGVAVLSANYVAKRLEAHFPTLYTGSGGLVAHECILDLRDLAARSGVTVDDVAKRLIDYGFHAPTMSFPVAGTLMVEPTESESKRELDRFCDAMIAIRGEIQAVLDGLYAASDSPLRNAPHTGRSLVGNWSRSYTREVAAFPTGTYADKYWPPVGRVEQAHGDRNLVCSCPPIESYGG